ncbi:hypothetical protein HII31_05370 [Pseudocercospora fuligena]|uniref:Ecp2 effector protein domain-containing protein n=1 Tax=Pseudocercospora fuligena TaxID=685502 RepID=A0A8H6RIV6_9PEZI|nr:hypothetical protein HII31_05370 [Pseudocercospora fuligena]
MRLLLIAFLISFACGRGLNIDDSILRRDTDPTTSCPDNSNTTRLNETNSLQDIIHKWGHLWSGNYTYADEILDPEVSLHQDRLPGHADGSSPKNPDFRKNPYTSVQIPIQGKEALLGGIKHLHNEFEYYRFIILMSFWSEDRSTLVTRWMLNATIREQTDQVLIEPGDKLHNNGTDIVMFDKCTGKIKQCITSQDNLDFTYQLGMNVVHHPELMPNGTNCAGDAYDGVV